MSHKKPVTRRDFLASGLIGGTATVVMPNLISMLMASRAYGAETCAAAAVSGKTPFICLDLAGGANIAGSNVIVGKAGGQLDYLANYTSLGLPAAMSPKNAGQINTELGIAFHADSAMLRGIKSVATAATLANVDGMVFCAQSGDDTGNNPHNPMYWIAKSGANGMLAKLIGTNNTVSGGSAASPASSINPAIRPVKISNPTEARNLITLGQLNLLFTPAKIDRILGAVNNMTASHLAGFLEKDLPTQIKDIMSCGYTKSRAITQDNADNYDPRNDALVTQVFPQIATNTEDAKVATVAKIVLDGVAGAGTISKGGYDYHSGNRADGEGKDFEAGKAIGQCLELAAKKGKNLMIYVFTDGSVTSNGTIDSSANGRGKGVWTGDSGERSAALILVYKAGAAGRPKLRNALRQVGAFNDSGAVVTTSSLVGRDVEKLSMAVLLNYMALDGTEGQIGNLLGGTNPFAGNLAQYLLLDKIA